jgi:hypothetical protein
MTTLYLLAAALLTASTCAASAVDGRINARDCGAIGDGKTDDSAAIQSAIDKARTGPRGTSVLLPPGEYRVTKPLAIEGVLMKGLDAGGWCADIAPLPTLRVDFTDGPCIIAKAGASIHGLNFEYDHKGETARKFGPTVLLTGVGISVTNVRIHQPYEGIMADGVSNLGRLNLDNVFIVSARKCGVYVTNTYDIPTIRNVEVWNPHDYSQGNCIGFKFGKNDEIRIEHCFAFKCRTGYLFVKEKDGDTWGGMTASSADFSIEGIVVESTTSLRVSGGSLWCHSTALRVDGPAKVVMTGVDMRANADSALIVRNCNALTLTGCGIGKNGDNWPEVFAARIEGGKSVLINACTFDAYGPGVKIAPSMDNFSITNNVFQPSAFETIVDGSAAEASKIITGNLSRKTEAKQQKTQED